jgi:diadenosine tetraphosphate (Ap4A) HIT family hydrolase
VAVLDGYPVSEGHTLLIPKRHCETYFDLNQVELGALVGAVDHVKEILDSKYQPNGYNIGVNCGEAAGQTVMHCHIHVIPRYDNDDFAIGWPQGEPDAESQAELAAKLAARL